MSWLSKVSGFFTGTGEKLNTIQTDKKQLYAGTMASVQTGVNKFLAGLNPPPVQAGLTKESKVFAVVAIGLSLVGLAYINRPKKKTRR